MQVTFNGLQFWFDDVAEYPAGHIVLREGQRQSGIYVLKKGAVEIIKQDQQMAVCDRRGDMFGEVSALTGEVCSTSVKTTEPSTFLLVEDANSFLGQNAQTALFVAKMLARRLADTTESHSEAKKKLHHLSTPKKAPEPVANPLANIIKGKRVYFSTTGVNELMWFEFNSDGTASTPKNTPDDLIKYKVDGLNVHLTDSEDNQSTATFQKAELNKGDNFTLSENGVEKTLTILMVE